ncbi:hypothetical protein RHMOL_Rhmol05G0169600 [Rhododendron molle]|uniref:Uncharacterized protein n=1 Tax=Rhododendron molle TaxID=49168 RepID=A0ACC0NRD5_RHOML|nr:hypothetical protein RHMOL_Rhmol05G0169600 [Rhododendron molle]
MAEGASKYLFFCLLILLTFFSSEVLPRKEIEQKDLKTEANRVFDKIPYRELIDHFHHKTTLHDTIYPPNFPTFTPTVVTIPSTVPVTVTVTPNPTSTSTPVPIPSSTTVPITNPVTTPSTVQPITNPVTSYPAPTTGVPVTTPVTVGTPAVSGQSWCVAKSGATESALQAALDYACGLGGAECSVIQEDGGCYNPNSLESHASFAFNSYYQKNPVQTSCDFGGTAVITYVNPTGFEAAKEDFEAAKFGPLIPQACKEQLILLECFTGTGTCIYQSSLASSSSPMTETTTSPTTTSSPGSIVAGSDSLPSVLNASNPASGSTSVFGDGPPSYPSYNTSTSMAINLQPFVRCIIPVASYIIGKVIFDV